MQSTSSPGKILVIDDDTNILISLKRLLERQGYEVAVHDGGVGCINIVRQFEPHLVLVDVKMPFISGEILVSLMAKHDEVARPTLVLFSGLDEPLLQKAVKDCGADGYISKTESSLELARKIAAFVRLNRTPLSSGAADLP